MNRDQLPYRRLYERLVDYDGSSAFADLLVPWLAGADEERRWLDAFAARPGSPVPSASQEDLWRLYALSRISDLLTTPFRCHSR